MHTGNALKKVSLLPQNHFIHHTGIGLDNPDYLRGYIFFGIVRNRDTATPGLADFSTSVSRTAESGGFFISFDQRYSSP